MSTRIIAFNVPPISPDELRKHFSQHSAITDLVMPRNSQGKPRGIVFVGYKTAEEAAKAAEFFDNSFIRTCRIKAQIAKPIGDPSLAPKVVVQPERKSFTQHGIAKSEKVEQLLALQNRQNWANDDTRVDVKAGNSTVARKTAKDDQDYQELPKKTNADSESEETESGSVKGDGMSDMEYMRSKMRAISNDEPHQRVPERELNESQTPEEEREKSPIEIIGETGRLFVRNLTYSATEEELTDLFSKYGPLTEVHIPINSVTKESKGYAFVLFMIPDNAITAYLALNKKSFQGRILDIFPGLEKPEEKPDDESLTFKKKKENERKKAASKAAFSWNSLFMNSDTVASAIAASLNVPKSELLSKDSNMAVRMALAETQVIQDTKNALEENGVNVDAFEKINKRSKSVILVKNIPYNTNVVEIEDLFARFGELGRIVFPNTRTLCIVEFVHANEAKTAFLRLAYSKFKHIPLYLEWCPENVFDESSELIPLSKKRKAEAREKEESVSIEPAPEKAEEVATNGATFALFVKNLSFGTSEDRLFDFFQTNCSREVKSVRIVTKTARDGKILSMGYGFVEFGDLESAKHALKTMHGKVLDNHSLEIKFSQKKHSQPEEDVDQTTESSAPSTKLLIRNVPFAATKKELQAVISPLGQIKSVRLPKKTDGGHRGFAFVELLTKMDAKNVYDGLKGHFYGRHLVVEYAKEEETIEEKRKKMVKLSAMDDIASRRVKLDDNDGEEDDFE